MIGFTELVADPQVGAGEKLKYFEAIKRNGELLANIINDILDLSRVEAGRMAVEVRETPLAEVLIDTEMLLGLQAEEKGIALNVTVDTKVPSVIQTDPMRLRQILINIIGNAIKFTEKGSVDVVVKSLTSPKGITRLAFSVTDSGRGIEKNQIGKLFVPFSQAHINTKRKLGGTGLGLVLSKRLANLLGGDVELISSQLNGIKILLADDSPSNGEEAATMAMRDTYEIILMDLQMPVVDGYEALAGLRKRGYRGKIVALTAHAMIEDKVRCIESGFDGHVGKPVNRAILIQEIKSLL